MAVEGAAPPADGGVQIEKHYEWVPVSGEYGEQGLSLRVWLGYPNGLLNALLGRYGENGVTRALQSIAGAHNGWRCAGGEPISCQGGETLADGTVCPGEVWHDEAVCEGGEPLPPADSPDFWRHDSLSAGLLQAAVITVMGARFQFPKGRTTNGGR